MDEKRKLILKAAILVLIALFSFFVIKDYVTTPEFHAETIAALEEKENDAFTFASYTALASVAISAVPGDATTPLANEVANLSTYFIIIVCVICLEKYLLTIISWLTFAVLIPIACIILAINYWFGNRSFAAFAKKLIAFGIVLFLVVPLSVQVSNMISETYAFSVEQTIENMENEIDLIKAEDSIEKVQNKEEKTKGILGASKEFYNTVTNTLIGIKEAVTDSAKITEVKVKVGVESLIEGVAVMLVTTCLIPILVLIFALWVTKLIFGIEVTMQRPKKIEFFKNKELD